MKTKKKLPKKLPKNIKLMPIGKDGKEIDWFYGWPGIKAYTKALGKTWFDVGNLIEQTWGDRLNFWQVVCCSEVHRSLEKVRKGHYANKKRLNMAPKGEEPDLHFAIRMNLKKITETYSKVGKAKDIYKAVSQLYNKTMASDRMPYVLTAAKDPK